MKRAWPYLLALLCCFALLATGYMVGNSFAEGCVSSEKSIIEQHKEADQQFYLDICLDSNKDLQRQIMALDSVNFCLRDSMALLNEKRMSEANFINLYKYERLLKYYNICKRDATQWKFYRGWSTRVFEE